MLVSLREYIWNVPLLVLFGLNGSLSLILWVLENISEMCHCWSYLVWMVGLSYAVCLREYIWNVPLLVLFGLNGSLSLMLCVLENMSEMCHGCPYLVWMVVSLMVCVLEETFEMCHCWSYSVWVVVSLLWCASYRIYLKCATVGPIWCEW